jgi:hypothetical protein
MNKRKQRPPRRLWLLLLWLVLVALLLHAEYWRM